MLRVELGHQSRSGWSDVTWSASEVGSQKWVAGQLLLLARTLEGVCAPSPTGGRGQDACLTSPDLAHDTASLHMVIYVDYPLIAMSKMLA